jgi:hypothetical protein
MKGKMIGLLATAISLLTLTGIAWASEVTVTTDVAPYIDATPLYDAVAFGSLEADSSNNIPTLTNVAGYFNFTIDTNKDYKVSASGTDFDGTPAGTITIDNMKFDTNTTKTNLAVGDASALDTSPAVIDDNIAYTNTVNFNGYWLDIPASQLAGSYSSTVTITYENVA